MNSLLNSEQNPEWSAATDDAQRTESRANKKYYSCCKQKSLMTNYK